MSNLHRIKWIDERIKKKTFPNCRTIADKFEISTRQASRDIEYLKYSLDAPVEYSPEKNGYYYSDDFDIIPSGIISQEEKQTLSYLAYRYRHLGSENELKIAELFDKLSGERQILDYKSHTQEIIEVKHNKTSNFAPIKNAIEESLKIKVRYRNAREEISTRILHPYRLFIKGSLDYLEAFCELRDSIRIFRLDRISIQKITEDKFERSGVYYPVYASSDDNFQFRKPFICRLKLKDYFNQIIKNQYLRNIDNEIYEISYYNSGDLIKFLFSLQCDFKIINPAWLKEKILKKLNQIIEENKIEIDNS